MSPLELYVLGIFLGFLMGLMTGVVLVLRYHPDLRYLKR